MTLNIWNYNDPWQTRRQLIATCINQAAPDVIGLQEIRVERDRSPENQAQQIIAVLGEPYDCVYRPAMTFESDPLREEGLAILSRWPIAAWEAVELTRDPTDSRDIHQRILLRADVTTPAGVLHFFNTHWSLSEGARLRNATEVRAAVARFARAAPIVLVGDLNSQPDAAAAVLLEPSGNEGDALLRDAWADLYPGDPGFTIKSDAPTRRIDYIAYNFSEGRFGRLRGIRLVGTEATCGILPSDHMGVVADFEIAGG
jgi:endonuclease/exonuclease/phosphatase family metal-dependent hydrolase